MDGSVNRIKSAIGIMVLKEDPGRQLNMGFTTQLRRVSVSKLIFFPKSAGHCNSISSWL